jgi:hypothetical protein
VCAEAGLHGREKLLLLESAVTNWAAMQKWNRSTTDDNSKPSALFEWVSRPPAQTAALLIAALIFFE